MNFWLIVSIIDAIVGFTAIFLILSRQLTRLSYLARTGLWFLAVGLIAQAYRAYSVYSDRTYPFEEFPAWVLKDIGIWIIFLAISLFIFKREN
jgi:hypothetical protein